MVIFFFSVSEVACPLYGGAEVYYCMRYRVDVVLSDII
jgi:hypothetical protein